VNSLERGRVRFYLPPGFGSQPSALRWAASGSIIKGEFLVIMSDGCTGIFVAREGEILFIQVRGGGNYQNAGSLRQCGQEALEQGCKMICLDLAQCRSLDSTFLGVLAGLGLRLGEKGYADALHVCNAGDHTLQSCEALGLDRVVQFDAGPWSVAVKPPGLDEFQKLPGSELRAVRKGDKNDSAELILEAHEQLCKADEGNEARFKEVKEYLRQGLTRGPEDPGIEH